MTKKIVIINGCGRSGKDTFCKFIENVYLTNIVSSARLPKQIAERYFGWTGQKTEKDRKLLSDLKDLLTEYKDLPFLDMCNAINWFYGVKGLKFLFIHVREPEEIKKLVNKYPEITTLLIRRNGFEINSNHADANIENYNYDYVIENNGSLAEFKIKALDFAKNLLEKE